MVAKPHASAFCHVAGYWCPIGGGIEINIKRLQDSVGKIDTKIDVVQSELRGEIQGVRGEIADVRTDVNQQIGSVREELSKLNQNHIDPLTRHDS